MNNSFKDIKYFIGPMTKNVIDACIEFKDETGNQMAFIPSRRQVDWDMGYTGFNTDEFLKYVIASDIPIMRDHAGPTQGRVMDDGVDSILFDSTRLDAIHIDPFKAKNKIFNIEDAAWETAVLIKEGCRFSQYPTFEVGTEEAIYRYSPEQLKTFLQLLKSLLEPYGLWKRVTYVVVQSGTALKGNNQIGEYDKKRLKKFLKVAKQFKLKSKEHNGDYIPVELIKEKFKLGLNAINIAPEFGMIESQTYLDYFTELDKEYLMDRMWMLCYSSGKWEKWVDGSFDPMNQKEELIKICGHYIVNYDEFKLFIKDECPGIDIIIKENIKKKLTELYG